MSDDLFLRFPIEVTLALLTLLLILLAVACVLMALRKPAPVRMPDASCEAPYKLEAQSLLLPGQVDVVPQAGREPANR
jgi:hypothetical protein